MCAAPTLYAQGLTEIRCMKENRYGVGAYGGSFTSWTVEGIAHMR